MHALTVHNLSKRYEIGGASVPYRTLRDTIAETLRTPWRRARRATHEEFWALHDVSFTVERGEVVGVIGKNGAGKSTLLKILSRITEPTGGSAEIYGRVGTLLEVGTGFHPELTGRENTFLNGAILGMRREEIARKFDEIVAFSEVEQFIDTPVKHYSSGMYLRLAFAVAAHLEPEILVVDEVLAVGDAAFQRKCLGKMGEIANQGRTVLFVSHSMGAVRGLCNRAIWLEGGRVRTEGPAREIVDQYLQTTIEPSATRIDVRDMRRGWSFGEQVRLTGVTFNGGTPVRHGQPLTAELHYTAHSDAVGVSFGFGFASLEGVRLMSVDSDLLGQTHDIARGTSGTITAQIDTLLLQPGLYALDLGIRSGDNSALDYLPACAQVEVLPGPDTPSMMIREGGGGVRMPAHWAVERI